MQSEQDEDTFIGGGVMKKSSFVEYITTITSRDKSQILNLLQYGGLTIIPILIILKCMKLYVPAQDPFKSSTEILLEVILQLFVIVLAFFFIHKLVIYVPTYSNVEYEHISLLSGILPLFFLMFTLDTKVSEKLTILFDRLLVTLGIKKEGMDEGEEESGDSTRPTNSSTTVSQCGSNTMLPPPTMETSRLIDGYPTKREPTVNSNVTSQMMPQGGGGIGMMTMDEPMAANSVLGGSVF